MLFRRRPATRPLGPPPNASWIMTPNQRASCNSARRIVASYRGRRIQPNDIRGQNALRKLQTECKNQAVIAARRATMFKRMQMRFGAMRRRR